MVGKESQVYVTQANFCTYEPQTVYAYIIYNYNTDKWQFLSGM